MGNQGTRKLEAGVSGARAGWRVDYSLGLRAKSATALTPRSSGSHNPDRDGYRSTSGNARLGLQHQCPAPLDATLLASRHEQRATTAYLLQRVQAR
jgi:vitamin B12 transporter